MYLALYVLLIVAMAANAPAELFVPGAREFVLIIGIVGAWRYSWGAVHFFRSIIYRTVVFPRHRRRLTRFFKKTDSGAEPEKPEVYLIVTAYRIPIETLTAVFRAAVEEAVRYGAPVTVVASIVEVADMRLVKQLFAKLQPPEHVHLIISKGRAQGKRDGLAMALNAIARQMPRAGAAVVVMDGDALLPPGSLTSTVPFLTMMPNVGGITTDEDAVVDGNTIVSAWHRLRFAQRHLLMSSMGLSRRLLTMTGRMSVFRVEIAIDPSFIQQIRDDKIDHWRLGPIKLLTGEDKSTWFWLLARQIDMLYVPDVRVLTIEHPPSGNFIGTSTQLMMRWFGNMLRASSRAIALGPGRVGFFAWWCLIDQRVSMWTPLIGPIAAICLSVVASPVFLYAYILWVLMTRLIQTLMLLSVRDTIHGSYPILIYFNQVYGALIKSYILFRPNHQRWTRQKISSNVQISRWSTGVQELSSALVHGIAMLALLTLIGILTGFLPLPHGLLASGPF